MEFRDPKMFGHLQNVVSNVPGDVGHEQRRIFSGGFPTTFKRDHLSVSIIKPYYSFDSVDGSISWFTVAAKLPSTHITTPVSVTIRFAFIPVHWRLRQYAQC